jgi:predicted amidohydrolase YtcJ
VATEAPEPAPAPVEGPADWVLRAGHLMSHSVDGAEALAVQDGKVIAIGSGEDIASLIGPDTKKVSLPDATCMPGLTDAHAHPAGLGRNLEIVDLRGAASVDEVVARIQADAPEEGWILGRGWDQNLWEGSQMPTHEALTAAFPDRPVWLRRVDGHAGWANAQVMALAGIEADTASPEGGEILRDASGAATGVFVDAAMSLIPVPESTQVDVHRWIRKAQKHLVSLGITGVHDMGVGKLEDQVYRRFDRTRELKLRITGYAGEDWFTDEVLGEREPDRSRPDSNYALVGVKVYADGALGSRGAALNAPYADRPDHSGLMSRDAAGFGEVFGPAMANGWQVATHAIGDRAIRTVLEAYATARRGAKRHDPRPRIEHAQIVDVEDIASFVDGEIIASMQPTHATSDMPWVPERIGEERLPGAYAWRRFLDAGVHLAFGSDFPVERPQITHGLYSAMTRQDPTGQPDGGWLPDQALTLPEAVHAFSAGAAYAAHQDAWLGDLAPGFVADISCFAGDLSTMSATEVRDAKAVLTVVGGTPVFKR